MALAFLRSTRNLLSCSNTFPWIRWYGTASRHAETARSLQRLAHHLQHAPDPLLSEWVHSLPPSARLRITDALCAPLEQSRRDELKKLFQAIDANKDGTICEEEFTNWHRLQELSNEQPIQDPKPTTKQLTILMLRNTIPMIGFGFADNFIMILAGESIDATFGSILHLSTMAAAGLGNLVSDVIGIGLSSSIEAASSRLGIPDHNLTLDQLESKKCRIVIALSNVFGISIGCLAGMVPLLFNS